MQQNLSLKQSLQPGTEQAALAAFEGADLVYDLEVE